MARPQPPSRPGPPIELVDDRSGPRVVLAGTHFQALCLPRGSRIIHPNPPTAPHPDPRAAIRHALAHPIDAAPLAAQLRPGLRLTIAIGEGGASLPLAPLHRPDLRAVMLNAVLDLCARRGVDDIQLIIAGGLRRHLTPPEIKRLVGGRVFAAYWPDRLHRHDAENPGDIVEIGITAQGEHIRLNRRAVERDLIVSLGVCAAPFNDGSWSLASSLADYQTTTAHQNTHVMHGCHSTIDPRPERSALASTIQRMDREIHKHLKVFHIEAALDARTFGGPMDFLNRPEATWSEFEWARLQASNAALRRLPARLRQIAFDLMRAPAGLIAVAAGQAEQVHAQMLSASLRQHSVPVRGQADVVVMGIPALAPDAAPGAFDPLQVQAMALGHLFNQYREHPVVKKDGVLILYHPCHETFDREHHPAAVEFYHRILGISTQSRDFHPHERAFVENPEYLHQYRYEHAEHPARPFHAWYRGDAGRAHVGHVIVVGPERARVPAQLGWECAPNFEAAMDMARGHTGKSQPDITLLHAPPFLVCDVAP